MCLIGPPMLRQLTRAGHAPRCGVAAWLIAVASVLISWFAAALLTVAELLTGGGHHTGVLASCFAFVCDVVFGHAGRIPQILLLAAAAGGVMAVSVATVLLVNSFVGLRVHTREHAEAVLSTLARSDEMKVRYVLVEPARALSLAHPERPAPLASFLDDRDAYVRARAAEAAAGVPSLGPKLAAKLADPEPRVREAALVSLASMGGAPEAEAIRAFETDEWTFVRVAAAKALGVSRAPTQASVASLEKALEGGSLLVRQAALSALSARRATSSAGAMAKLARDADSPLELRVAATRALGAVCASSEVDYLTRAAVRALAPIDEADLRVGVAAIDALGRIHPRDLNERLAKLREKTVRLPLKSAADRAVAETDVCR